MSDGNFISTDIDFGILYDILSESTFNAELASTLGVPLPLKMSTLSFRIAICQNVDYIRKG